MNLILLQSPSLPTPVLLILMGIVFYFFLIRPQNKQRKEAKNLLENLKKGDKIITSGGIHGKIIDTQENTFLIEVGNSTKMKIEKNSISMEMTKSLTEPKVKDKK